MTHMAPTKNNAHRLHGHGSPSLSPTAALGEPADDPVLNGPLGGSTAVAVAINASHAARVALGATADAISPPAALAQ